MSSNKPGTST